MHSCPQCALGTGHIHPWRWWYAKIYRKWAFLPNQDPVAQPEIQLKRCKCTATDHKFLAIHVQTISFTTHDQISTFRPTSLRNTLLSPPARPELLAPLNQILPRVCFLSSHFFHHPEPAQHLQTNFIITEYNYLYYHFHGDLDRNHFLTHSTNLLTFHTKRSTMAGLQEKNTQGQGTLTFWH